MAIAFLGGTDFKVNEVDSTCMLFTTYSFALGKPTDFYFTGDNGFIRHVYDWCKRYQDDVPGSRLIYVVADEDSEDVLEKKKQQYDLVVRPQINTSKSPYLSVLEQYMVDQCQKIIIYRDGGVDDCRAASYAIVREKRVADYYVMRNRLIYSRLDSGLTIWDRIGDSNEIENYPNRFVKNALLYLHIHPELMEDPDDRILYESGILYLIRHYEGSTKFIGYDFELCKKYIIEELDILAEELAKKHQSPLTKKEVSSFCKFLHEGEKKDKHSKRKRLPFISRWHHLI